MTYALNALVVVLAVAVFTSGCSKKSKSARPAGKPAAAAATAPAEELKPTDGPSRDEVIDPSEDPPARFNEAERRRFSDEGRVRSIPPDEMADAPDVDPSQIPEDGPRGDVAPEAAGPIEGTPDQCGTAFGHNSQQWAPGLPNPPSQARICTGGSNRRLEPGERFVCEGSRDLVYTDARQDGIMATAVDMVNRLPRHMDHGSRELARRIRGVKMDFGASVRAQMQLQISADNVEEIEFRGSLRSGRSQAVPMLATNAPRGLRFSALLTCADADGSCANAILRVHQLARSGKVGRVAYVVLRSGEAHVTMTEQDRKGFRQLTNPAHAEFAQYLSNTAYNTCVSILRDTINGQRQLPTCAYNRLKNICGRRAQFKRPAAQSFEFNSWSVAYGQAGFEFEMIDRGATRFRVQGPLVAGPNTPVSREALRVTGAFGSLIDRAALVANDGGGNLNLQIDFKGDASTRISVTTLNEDVRYNSEVLVSRARQMPALSEREMVSERELRAVAQRRAEVRAPRETPPRAANAPRPPAPIPAARPAAPRAANAPRPPAPIPAARPAAPAPSAAPATGRPNVATRPLPPNPTAAPRPTAAPNPTPSTPGPIVITPTAPAAPAPAGPRFEATPTPQAPATPSAPPGGVPPREQEDDEVIQPGEGELPPPPPESEGPDQN